MQQLDDRLLLSATDLINYLECPHLTTLDLEVAAGRLTPDERRADAAALVARKGDEHEAAHLATLRASGQEVVEIASEPGLDGTRRAAARTVEAMRAGAEIIYQGVLFDGERWRGHADFLERVESPSALGSWSYEVADTKLAKRVKPYFLLQLCLYSELLAAVQGAEPSWMHVVLGTHERESFRLAEFSAYYRSVRRQFDAALKNGSAVTYPDPVDHCEVCRWDQHCSARREADDHLSQVANIRRTQTVRVVDAGMSTMAALAEATPEARPVRIGEHAFDALRNQARLQVEQRATGTASYELLVPEDDRGFARLPMPSAGDLYFDMEGDPFFDGGLEYLFGVTAIDDAEPRFRAFWAISRAEEKIAFERFVDFVIERHERFPDLHIYHYAPYETTALKRLMGLHATREEEIDHLLRNEVFVDLYAVVRQGLRISQPSYSIKKVEAFYMDARDTEVADGGDSILAFEEFLETGDRALLENIERYNDDDCRSTWLLHKWLLQRREEAIASFDTEIGWRERPVTNESDEEALAEDEALRERLLEGLPEDEDFWDAEDRDRWLLAQLLDYHRREAKPQWWAYFDRLDADEAQLIEEDNEALGGLRDAGVEPVPLPAPKRSLVHTLAFDPQEHKIGPGSYVDPATEKAVNVQRVDDALGIVEITRDRKLRDEPLPRALIPGKPYTTTAQRAALRRLAADVAEDGVDGIGRYRAARSVLRRELPRTGADPGGEPLQNGSFDIDEAARVVDGLDESHLFIQGPPGSGKTHNGALLICRLLAAGKRVAVTATSHAAINNLLTKVEELAGDAVDWRGHKHGAVKDQYTSTRPDPLIDNSNDIGDVTGGAYRLVAGTAWLFAREEVDGMFDYLFVDEAGQVSLADALALATCARNLVLLGDPQQLAQVSQAVHPPGAGASVLEHLLGENGTIPPERGLFIDETRRMHPDVCRFVSEAVYEGRLRSLAACATQDLRAAGGLSGTGVRHLPVVHHGNARQSPEEARLIAECVSELLGSIYVDDEGQEHVLGASNIMVVAPYNAQVRCLKEHLPEGVRIGTVDKFQGQEAVVTFFSMATSSGAELPRNIEFLFSRNRLNVAVSRARCLAVLVCSPELLQIRCRTAEQMRLVSALCLLTEMARAGPRGVAR